MISILQQLATACIHELLQHRRFFIKRSHIQALQRLRAGLLSTELTNKDLIQRTLELKESIRNQGWLGIPGFGCGYYLKNLDSFLKSAEQLKSCPEEELQAHAIRKLAVIAGNEIKLKQHAGTDKSRGEALGIFLNVAYSPYSNDQQIITAAEDAIRYVRTQGKFGFWRQRGSYFLERMQTFLKQAKAIYVNPPYGLIPRPPMDIPRMNFVDLHRTFQPPMAEKTSSPLFERKNLQEEITRSLTRHCPNMPILTSWNAIKDEASPLVISQFFISFEKDISALKKAHPEDPLETTTNAYLSIILKEVDREREKLENMITETLQQYHHPNIPIMARWLYRLNKIKEGDLPTELFFNCFAEEISLFNKAHPEKSLEQTIKDYLSILRDKNFKQYWYQKELGRYQASPEEIAAKKGPIIIEKLAPMKQSSLFGTRLPVSSLVGDENKLSGYRFNGI